VQTKLNYTLRKSSAVIVGNEFLANYAKKYNKNITIIPTVINPDEYPKKIHAYKKSITLGWIGQSVNFQYLSELHQQFLEIRRSIDFELLVISDKDFKMEGIEVTNERWSIKTELQSILKMDIGLMPLKENEWTNGKCSFKAIQYMASGIPTIASDVGSNKNLITNGVNGFLAKTPNDWADYIKALQSDHLLRIKIGKESIKTIEQKFSQKFAFQMLLKCIQTINDTPKK